MQEEELATAPENLVGVVTHLGQQVIDECEAAIRVLLRGQRSLKRRGDVTREDVWLIAFVDVVHNVLHAGALVEQLLQAASQQ